jgi:chemotaxis protein histidine kinase CheA
MSVNVCIQKKIEILFCVLGISRNNYYQVVVNNKLTLKVLLKMSSIVEIVETPVFNASFAVTDLLMKTLENAAKTVAVECVKACGNQYGFNAEEAIRMLGLENLALTRKMMAKKSAGIKKLKSVKEPKAAKEASFPFPFCSGSVNSNCCQGITYNRGLFTQCSKEKMDNSSYCKVCQADALTNAAGVPTCGNIEMRLATGLYDYKDSKGRKPASYLKVLAKLKLTKEAAIEAASKQNIEIDELHFQGKEKSKKTSSSPRGRPKKASTAINADGASDLFAQLQSEDSENDSDNDSNVTKKSNKLSEEEKSAKKAALEAERQQKKADREAKIAAEKAEKEEKRKAEAAEKKAEREAKAAAEKAEREIKRNQEKAEREAKRKQEKESKKPKKEADKKPKNAKKSEEEPNPKAQAEEKPKEQETSEAKPQKVTVTRIKIDDVEYLKSSTNILYNPKTREEVGMYDPINKTIIPLPDDDEEEEEDGYESE